MNPTTAPAEGQYRPDVVYRTATGEAALIIFVDGPDDTLVPLRDAHGAIRIGYLNADGTVPDARATVYAFHPGPLYAAHHLNTLRRTTVWVAQRDIDTWDGTTTDVIGVYSTMEFAKAACARHAAVPTLDWSDMRTTTSTCQHWYVATPTRSSREDSYYYYVLDEVLDTFPTDPRPQDG